MNLSEFKSWFEGFTECMDSNPTEKQWVRVKEKIGQIKDAPPVTQHHFYDHYANPWRRWYNYSPGFPQYTATTAGCVGQNVSNSTGISDVAQLQMQQMQSLSNGGSQAPMNYAAWFSELNSADAFNSAAAFRELGRAEMRSMTKK